MILSINTEINNEVLDRLVRTYNELKENEKLEVYFSSEGGDVEIGEAIIDLINEHADITSVVGYGTISSAAFDIFFRITCPKSILISTLGMAHSMRVELDKYDLSSKTDQQEFKAQKEWAKEHEKYRLDVYEKIGLNKKELTDIKKGNDVYFQFNRMIELVKHNNG